MKTLKGLLWMTLVLVACKPAELQPTLMPVDTVAPPPTSTPFIFPATWTPVPTAVPIPVLRPKEILDFETLTSDREQHHLILFTSLVSFPLNGLTIGGYTTKGDPISFTDTQMWAVSPDGKTAGRLTPDNISIGFYKPSDPSAKSLITQYVIRLNNDRIQNVKLPGECYGQLAKGEEWAKDLLEPCGNFKFSPDGRYLAFNFGPEVCGRGILVIDIQKGDKLYRSMMGGGHGFQFLSDSTMLIFSGACEGGGTALLDLNSGILSNLGAGEAVSVNYDSTALTGLDTPYIDVFINIWGYNLATRTYFLNERYADHPIWVPDGKYVLFQQRPVKGNLFDKPRQVKIVEADSGKIKVLASDNKFDYDLCCAGWFGEWIQIRRFPFHVQKVLAQTPEDWYTDPVVQCRVYGYCPEPPEFFALNWRTGELVPWEQAPLPTVTPTPAPTATPIPGPDLNGVPVYAEPSGAYAFYVGQDGHSLWMVPARGKPQLWVTEGENFIYIP